MNASFDGDLVESLRRGDRQAFDAFIDRYTDRVHRLMARRVSERAAAEQLTEAALAHALAHIEGYDGSFRFDLWVVECCRAVLARRVRPASDATSRSVAP